MNFWKFLPASFGGKSREAILLSGANLLNYALSMLAGLVAARILVPEEYATKVLVFSIVGLASSFADLGISFSVMKDSGGKSGREVFSSGFWLSSISGFIFFILLFPAFLLAGNGYGLNEPLFFGLYAVSGLLKQVSSVCYSYLISKERSSLAARLNALSGISYFALVSILTGFFGLLGFFLGIFLSSAIDCALKVSSAFLLIRGGKLTPFSGIGPLEKNLVRTGLAATGAGFLYYVVLNAPNFSLGLLADRAIVAYFAVAILPIYPISIVSGSVASSVLSGLRRAKGRERERIAKKTLRFSALAGLGLALLAIPGYWLLTEFFLVKYRPSLSLLILLAIPLAIEGSINSVSSTFLLALGKNRPALFGRGIEAASIAILAPILGLSFGVYGVIGAFSAGILLGAFFLSKELKKSVSS